MKHIKKLLSILMVLTLVLSLGVTAFAATVTLPEDAQDHTMVAYQIFKGEQLTPGDNGQLGVTAWGANITDPEAFLTAMGSYGLKSGMTPMEAAKTIGELTFENDAARVAFANAIATAVKAQGAAGTSFTANTAELEDGYWVVVDETSAADLAGEGKDTRSTVILEVVGADLVLRDKIDKPTVEKKVNGADNDVAELGEIVTFTVTTKLPTNYGDFQKYIVKFMDNMGKGLTPVEDDDHQARLQIGGWSEYIDLDWEEGSDVYAGGHNFTYTSVDLKSDARYAGAKAGDTVTLTYYAQINDDAVVRNYNDVTLYYPNDPNWDDEGEPPTTPTPPDTVVVFTFFVDGTKVKPGAEEGKFEPLEGAAFTLFQGASDEAVKNATTPYRAQVETKKNDDGKYVFDFGKLGEGFYRLEETVVPAGYNKADDVYFEIRQTKDPATGNVTAVDVYLKGEDGVYHQVDAEKFSFAVNAATPTEGEGHLKEQIINREGLELPETGGIGTTIFYVIGAVLVAAAVVLLVTKKRMSGADK